MKNINEVLNPWSGFEKLTGILNSKKSLLINYGKINNLPIKIRLSKKKRCDLLVIGFSIYNELDVNIQKRSHVFLRPRDLLKFKLKILKSLDNFTFDLKTYSEIYLHLKSNNIYNFNFYEDQLKKILPKAILIQSTIDPIQRLWVYWAKKLGIKIICQQHGVFSSLSVPEIKESNIVDYYLSFGKKQSELIKKIIPIDKHIYLYDQKFFYSKINSKRELNLCLIGTDHERYGVEGQKNKEIILSIYKKFIISSNNNVSQKLKFFYKKHPSEFLFNDIFENASIFSDKNYDDIDIYVGIASTMLMNMASKKVCTIQILSKDFIQDNYETYGFCKSIEINSNSYVNLDLLLNSKIKIPYLYKKNINKILNDILKIN